MPKRRVKLSAEAFMEHFGALEDPREEGMCDHLLLDILVIAVLATVCGADGWTEIHAFGKAKAALLGSILELPAGIPSVHTFQRVFSRIRPGSFEACFRSWIGHLEDHTEGRLIAVDGKSLRGAIKRSVAGQGLHLVHAWSVHNRLLLGQLATDVKSNEIKAIPELLKLLDLTGAVVSIDAMGCQTEIVKTVRAGGANYLLAVKENQPTLHAAMSEAFDKAATGASIPTSVAIDDTVGNGRVERRRIVTMAAPPLPELERWDGLKSFVLIESERRTDEAVTFEHRYYITDLPHDDPKRLGAYVRGHWSVENQLHWQLDVAFREDASQVSVGHGPESLSTLRKIALTMVTRMPSRKNGVAVSRKRAGWDDEFLLKILAHGMIG